MSPVSVNLFWHERKTQTGTFLKQEERAPVCIFASPPVAMVKPFDK